MPCCQQLVRVIDVARTRLYHLNRWRCKLRGLQLQFVQVRFVQITLTLQHYTYHRDSDSITEPENVIIMAYLGVPVAVYHRICYVPNGSDQDSNTNQQLLSLEPKSTAPKRATRPAWAG